MMLIDTHTHLYDDAFDADIDIVIKRSQDNKIGAVLMPAVDSASHTALLSLSSRYPGYCLPMMGLHPTSVNGNPGYVQELKTVERYFSEYPGNSRFVAVGEIGLDLYWSQDSLKEQLKAFELQIEIALMNDLPIVVHTRNAWGEMIDVLAKYKGRSLKGVMHSFSGTYSDSAKIMECGDFYFGIGGPITYKNNNVVPEIAKIPIQRILLETDSPYLPPVPFRGKRNESSYLGIIAQKASEIFEMSLGEIANVTTQNALRLFGLDNAGLE